MIMIEQVKKTPIPLDRNELVLNTWYMVSNTPDMQKRKIGTLVIKIGSEMIAFEVGNNVPSIWNSTKGFELTELSTPPEINIKY